MGLCVYYGMDLSNFPLFLICLLRKLKFLIPTVDFAPPPHTQLMASYACGTRRRLEPRDAAWLAHTLVCPCPEVKLSTEQKRPFIT